MLSLAPPSLFCSNLETVSWLDNGVGLFTISVTGVLYLQVSSAGSAEVCAGQEGAFHVPNSRAGHRVYFSAHLRAQRTLGDMRSTGTL